MSKQINWKVFIQPLCGDYVVKGVQTSLVQVELSVVTGSMADRVCQTRGSNHNTVCHNK